jgi:Flp pilus assembly protein TadD
MLAREGALGEALTRFEEAVKKAPEDPAVNFNLALCAAELGKDDLAIEYFKKHLALAPNDPVSHYNLATLMLKAGDRNGAALHFGEALRINPSDEDAKSWLGKLSR